MTEPFNANEFRRQQLGGGQTPQGQAQSPPQPSAVQPQMPPQYAPQAHPQIPHQPVPYQPVAPQTMRQAPPHMQGAYQPQPHQQAADHAAGPASHALEQPEEKKSWLNRGAKKAKVKKVKEPREKGATSPFLVFATGLVAGILLTVMGLRVLGGSAETPIRDVAAVPTAVPSEISTELSTVQTQLEAVKGLAESE